MMRNRRAQRLLLATAVAHLSSLAACGSGVSLNPGRAPSPTGAAGADGGVAMGDPDAGTQDAPPPCAQFGAGHANALAYTSDGRSWAAAYSSGAVVVYDASTGAITQRLPGHVGAANTVAFTPDGAHLVSAGDDGLVKAWKVADGTLTWSGQGDSLSSVESVAVSPDGTLVASTGIQGTMKLWRVDDGTLLRSWPFPVSQLTVLFTPDGTGVVSSAGASALFQIFSVTDGSLVKETNFNDGVHFGSISPDGKRLVGWLDRPQAFSVGAWNLADGSRAWLAPNAHSSFLAGVAMPADGSTVASAGTDGAIKLWRASDGTPLRTIAQPPSLTSIAFAPDGASLVGGTPDGDVRTWRASDGTQAGLVQGSPGNTGTLTRVEYSPDGTVLGSAGDQLDLWRVADGTLLRTIPLTGAASPQSFAFSADGSMVVTAGSTAQVWHVADGSVVASVGASVHGVTFGPDDSVVTSCRCQGDSTRPLRVFKLDGTEGLGLGNLGEMASAFAFAPDGNTVAIVVGSLSMGSIAIQSWRLSDHTMLWRVALDGGPAISLADAAIAFSADGKLLTATSVGASTVSIFSATDGSVVKSDLAPQHGDSQDVAFSHDQSLLGVASGDGIQLWRTHDWTRASTLGPGLSLSSLSFSPSASRAAAGSANGIVYQWCNLAD